LCCNECLSVMITLIHTHTLRLNGYFPTNLDKPVLILSSSVVKATKSKVTDLTSKSDLELMFTLQILCEHALT